MATTKNIFPFDEDKTERARGIKLAKNIDPGNFYRRKAKMDADNDMSVEKYDPTEGKKRGRKLLDDLLDGV